MTAATLTNEKAKGGGASRRRKLVRLSLFAMFCLYLGFSPYTFYAGLEFFPKKFDQTAYPPSGYGIVRENVAFTPKGGGKVKAWYFPVKGARYAAVIHHGQGDNIAYSGYYDTALVLRDCGASVLLYDYEGFGASEGSPSNEAMRRDALAAYEFLTAEKHFAPEKIVHCGVSLGTGPACDVASSKPCAGVILLSPYLSLSKIARHHLPFLSLYPPFLFPQPDLGSEELLGSKIKAMVVQGEKDMIIPVAQADEFSRHYKGPLTYIRLAGAYHIGGLSYAPGSPYKGSALDICRRFFAGLN